MRQQTLADGSFEKFRKKNRKELFLDDMEQIIPWQDLCGVIEPYYPKPEGAGRDPVGIERMLRIHYLQHWFDLSDPGAEEALFDSRAMRTLETSNDRWATGTAAFPPVTSHLVMASCGRDWYVRPNWTGIFYR